MCNKERIKKLMNDGKKRSLSDVSEKLDSHGDKFVNLEVRESGKDPLKKGSELGTSAD